MKCPGHVIELYAPTRTGAPCRLFRLFRLFRLCRLFRWFSWFRPRLLPAGCSLRGAARRPDRRDGFTGRQLPASFHPPRAHLRPGRPGRADSVARVALNAGVTLSRNWPQMDLCPSRINFVTVWRLHNAASHCPDIDSRWKFWSFNFNLIHSWIKKYIFICIFGCPLAVNFGTMWRQH